MTAVEYWKMEYLHRNILLVSVANTAQINELKGVMGVVCLKNDALLNIP
jgi:hypothetical protein